MFEIGKPIGRTLVEIPKEVLTTSIPGKVYHIHVDIKGTIEDERTLVNTLKNELLTKFNAKVKYIRIIGNCAVDIQLEGSPFAWAALVVWLPTIFTMFGITLIGISIYTVFAAIPGWAWGTLVIGTLLVVFAPTIGKLAKPVR